MNLDDIYETMPIKNNVSAIIKYKIFKIKSKLGYRSNVKLFIKMIHGMSDYTQVHLYVIQISSTRFYFIRIVELII